MAKKSGTTEAAKARAKRWQDARERIRFWVEPDLMRKTRALMKRRGVTSFKDLLALACSEL